MFLGEYTLTVEDGSVEVGFDLQGAEYSVLCVRWADAAVSVLICPAGAEDADAYGAEYTLLEQREKQSGQRLALPDAFLAELNGEDEVVALGMMDKIEIVKKCDMDALMPDTEALPEILSQTEE